MMSLKLSFLSFSLLTLSCFSEAKTEKPGGIFTAQLDNDLFGGSDQNYTNGVRYSYISENRKLSSIDSVQKYLSSLTGGEDGIQSLEWLMGFDDIKKVQYNYGLAFSQFMYTPEDRTPRHALPNQRPYAGWLGLSFSLHAKDDKSLNSVGLHIGVTGEEALAHPTQDTVHKAQNIPIFHGWDNQIPTEVTLDLSLEHKGRFDMVKPENSKFSIDGYHESGLQVGNFRTAAILGAQFRGGYNLPVEYSDPRISLNSYTQRPNIEGAETTGKFSAYLLSGFRGSAVAHDISLDGPIFNDEFHTEIEREVLVAEAYLGFGLRWRRVELSYAHTWRSREFDKQDNWQDFGSVSLRYSF